MGNYRIRASILDDQPSKQVSEQYMWFLKQMHRLCVFWTFKIRSYSVRCTHSGWLSRLTIPAVNSSEETLNVNSTEIPQNTHGPCGPPAQDHILPTKLKTSQRASSFLAGDSKATRLVAPSGLMKYWWLPAWQLEELGWHNESSNWAPWNALSNH